MASEKSLTCLLFAFCRPKHTWQNKGSPHHLAQPWKVILNAWLNYLPLDILSERQPLYNFTSLIYVTQSENVSAAGPVKITKSSRLIYASSIVHCLWPDFTIRYVWYFGMWKFYKIKLCIYEKKGGRKKYSTWFNWNLLK